MFPLLSLNKQKRVEWTLEYEALCYTDHDKHPQNNCKTIAKQLQKGGPGAFLFDKGGAEGFFQV